MGRFPWSHGHSRQSSAGSIGKPQDWFSKTTNEPSRQALNELRKEHSDGGAEGSQSPMARSRSNTTSSKVSKHSKSPSSARSDEVVPRPESRQSTFLESLSFGSAGQEKQGRGFFSKGSRMIKRKASKLTLQPSAFDDAVTSLSDQIATGDGMSPPAKVNQRVNMSPRGSTNRPSISSPFDFQHVAHTNQAQYQSLNKAFMMDVVSEDSQPTTPVLPEAIHDTGETLSHSPSLLPHAQRIASPPISPTTPLHAELPMTPPKPQPPPKDDMTVTATPEMRLSKSMENFSRPTRSPCISFEVSPIDMESRQLPLTSPPSPLPNFNNFPLIESAPLSPTWANFVNQSLSNLSSRRGSAVDEDLLNKPLPQPPTVVHAVSTVDDSALMMRIAPLPNIPESSSPATTGPELNPLAEKTSPEPVTVQHQSLRHMQTFPSGKDVRHRSQSSSELALAKMFNLTTMPPSPCRLSAEKRVSIGIKKIDIEDWEDAIDYSWDHPPDVEESSEAEVLSPAMSHSSTPLSPKMFVTQQTVRNGRSLPPSLKPLVFKPNQQTHVDDIQSPTVGYTLQKLHKSETCLRGLGIGGAQPNHRHKRSSDEALGTNIKRQSVLVPAIRREAGSAISKSSSQESIILSIASSIMGTQRSSNSSTSLSDLSHLGTIEDESNLPAEKTSSSDSSVEALSDASQDTVTTEPKTASTPATEAPSPSSKRGSVASKSHQRTTSISRSDIPKRTSSIPALPNAPAPRSRSSTLNSRSRQTSRVSYSLFPTPKSPSFPPPPPPVQTQT